MTNFSSAGPHVFHSFRLIDRAGFIHSFDLPPPLPAHLLTFSFRFHLSPEFLVQVA